VAIGHAVFTINGEEIHEEFEEEETEEEKMPDEEEGENKQAIQALPGEV
jgi:hypothetical protein